MLSLPIPLRYLLASHPELLSPVLGVINRAIFGLLIKKLGLKRMEAQAGGVTFVQRFGSALNLNIHFHCLVLDGVYHRSGDDRRAYLCSSAFLYNLTSVEYGRFLQLYLGLSAKEVINALEKMIAGGDNEFAFRLAIAAEKRYTDNKTITDLKEEAANRIRSVAQIFDPFKFISYTEMIGKEHKPILKASARIPEKAHSKENDKPSS